MSALRAAWIVARQGVRARRRRVLLTAVGIALASAMLAAAVVVSYGLGTGFDRAARAASCRTSSSASTTSRRGPVAQRIAALPDVARYALRLEVTNVGIDLDRRREFRGRRGRRGDRSRPRRGYAIVAGRDLRNTGSELLVERAFAARVGGPARRQDGRPRARADARRRVRRGARQRRLSRSRSRASTSRAPRSTARFGRERQPAGQPRADLAARPDVPGRGARAGAGHELRPAQHHVRDDRRRPGPARPGRRDRDRPARRAVADRARHRGRDAGRVGARGGPAAAWRDRRPAGGRSDARAGDARAGDRGRCSSRCRPPPSACSAGCSPPTGRPRDCSSCSTNPPPAARSCCRWSARGCSPRRCRRSARPGRRGAPAAARSCSCSAAPTSRRRARRGASRWSAGLATLGARLVGARRVRLIATALTLGLSTGVRAADARARVGAQHARDRSQRARQALPADRHAAAVRSASRRADPGRASRSAALRGRGRRRLRARGDDQRDRLPRRPHARSRLRRSCPAGACADRGRPRSVRGSLRRSG